MPSRTFLFAGGGTGGHIYPGLAIAERLVEADPDVRCFFLCSERAIDDNILKSEKLAGEPVEYRSIPAKPFSISPIRLARFFGGWGSSIRIVRGTIVAARQRAVTLVAMGGFVAAPAAQAARVESVPITLVNLDAVPGKANRWIAKHADSCFTSAPVRDVRWQRVPPIVRKAAVAPFDPATCRKRLGLDPSCRTILVTGASLGASSINQFILTLVQKQPGVLLRDGWQVIHQTGKSEVDSTRAAYQRAGVRALVEPFYREIGIVWGAADCALSRAGAGSVAEAWANRVPTMFLPYPFHKDQHQRHNAVPLVEAGAAMLETDRVNPDSNIVALLGSLLRLLDHEQRRRMRDAFGGLGPANGAEAIANALLA